MKHSWRYVVLALLATAVVAPLRLRRRSASRILSGTTTVRGPTPTRPTRSTSPARSTSPFKVKVSGGQGQLRGRASTRQLEDPCGHAVRVLRPDGLRLHQDRPEHGPHRGPPRPERAVRARGGLEQGRHPLAAAGLPGAAGGRGEGRQGPASATSSSRTACAAPEDHLASVDAQGPRRGRHHEVGLPGRHAVERGLPGGRPTC